MDVLLAKVRRINPADLGIVVRQDMLRVGIEPDDVLDPDVDAGRSQNLANERVLGALASSRPCSSVRAVPVGRSWDRTA
ncbi:hypothetical protein [Streptomyces sp. SID1121]|uniref:hypothetical protein n=1 Tax=Streptomyces sp. SID1121 TaxID=3425888 RepID=UPI0040566366